MEKAETDLAKDIKLRQKDKNNFSNKFVTEALAGVIFLMTQM